MDFSLKPLSSWCCSSVQIFGWLPRAWDGSWGVSKTRWRGNLRVGYHSGYWTEGGSTPRCRRQERRWGMIQCKPTFDKVRIRLHSIFQRNRCWACARRMRGSGGGRWVCVGGYKRGLTWRVKGRYWRRRQRRTRMGWRNTVGGLKRKTTGSGATETGTK